ncbi:MAG TPA: hypothetical protein VK988_18250 [Acidimicrobiales bacterium]|nr:hypothetical protein [Acidimicrobiales bacterium]
MSREVGAWSAMAVLEEQARALADGVDATLPRWVERSVERLLVAYSGSADPAAMAAARDAGKRARADVGARVRALLDADIDEQHTNPLSILRQAVRYPTDVLRRAGVPPVERDRFAEERFPDDDYDLTPASFADIDPSLFDVGVEWGAAKAWVHKQRHGVPPNGAPPNGQPR